MKSHTSWSSSWVFGNRQRPPPSPGSYLFVSLFMSVSDCEVCSIRPLVACEPFRCFPPSTGWSIPQEHTHTRDVTLGNRFRNFFSISRHFQRPLTVHRAPTVATSRCQSGRCRPPQQQQQQQTHQHRVRARSIDKERPPNLPLRLLLPTEILFAVVFFVESLFLLPPRINLA